MVGRMHSLCNTVIVFVWNYLIYLLIKCILVAWLEIITSKFKFSLILPHCYQHLGFTRCLHGKESACWCRRHGFDPWVRKTPLIEGMATHSSILAWRIPWTEESGSPWGCKELVMTEHVCTHTHTQYYHLVGPCLGSFTVILGEV